MFTYDVTYSSRNYHGSNQCQASELMTFCKSENVNLEYLVYTLGSLKRK